jgi:hypothetical protein
MSHPQRTKVLTFTSTALAFLAISYLPTAALAGSCHGCTIDVPSGLPYKAYGEAIGGAVGGMVGGAVGGVVGGVVGSTVGPVTGVGGSVVGGAAGTNAGSSVGGTWGRGAGSVLDTFTR